ncbi:hypothetical protein A2U01_0089494, partial [Trifolium medium]|nr:hypothetical protein [Trifolium medium]
IITTYSTTITTPRPPPSQRPPTSQRPPYPPLPPPPTATNRDLNQSTRDTGKTGPTAAGDQGKVLLRIV